MVENGTSGQLKSKASLLYTWTLLVRASQVESYRVISGKISIYMQFSSVSFQVGFVHSGQKFIAKKRRDKT